MTMKLYFAPLEGITTYVYRNTHYQFFGGCDEYYAPFVSPSDNEKIGRKGFSDIEPGHNCDKKPVVQVLTNNALSFVKFSQKIKAMGYNEVNLNLGCPSGTVVGKMRGSGFLRDRQDLDRFFTEIFEKSDIKVSVKTRSGFFSGDELDELMKIYNKYPLERLIVHPRSRVELYKGRASMDVFERAYDITKNPIVYNGDVFSKDDYLQIEKCFLSLDGVMIGRGAVANPAIFREIKGGKPLSARELVDFSEALTKNYHDVLRSDTFTLNKMKEVWLYMMWNFPQEKKILKAVKKAAKLSELLDSVKALI